jgi:hypothetical protein
LETDAFYGGMVETKSAGQHDGVYYSMGYAGHGVQMAT